MKIPVQWAKVERHNIFVGELAHTYADETVLDDGKIDIAKVRLLLFDMASTRYWSLGPSMGKCLSVGKSLAR